MLIEQQMAERREQAQSTIAKILEQPNGGSYGDYRVESSSRRSCRVAMRGPGCSRTTVPARTSPPILWARAYTSRRFCCGCGKSTARPWSAAPSHGPAVSISPQYGDTIEVRLRLPASPSAALQTLALKHFERGLLRREHFRHFQQVLEAFRNANAETVIYSDVLEGEDPFVDRQGNAVPRLRRKGG